MITPMSTLQHWCDEILQWLPSFRFLVYRGNASQLAAVEKDREKYEKSGKEFARCGCFQEYIMVAPKWMVYNGKPY